MTCKDCIHYDMCERMPFTEDLGEECDYFGWKRRSIELPCEVGDIVYCIYDEKVLPALVLDFYVDKVGILVGLKISLNGENPNALSSVHYIDRDSFTADDIYITKEEAEGALQVLLMENVCQVQMRENKIGGKLWNM